MIETKIHKTFYFLIFSLVFLIRITISQDLDSITLSKSYQSQPLKTVLEELENQLNVKFSYLDKHVKGKLITVNFINKKLPEALRLILKDTELSFEIYIKSRDIVLYLSRGQSGIEDDLLRYTLKGKVFDKLTEEPLAYANLHLKGTKRGGVSDSSGLFAFLNVSAKKDTLEVHYIGYKSREVPASVSNEKDLLKIKMDQSPLLTEKITVTGEKNRSFEISENQAGALQFSPQDMKSLPSIGGSDYQRVLQLMPGISGRNDKPSELSILGGQSAHNLVYLDGIPVCTKPNLYFGMLNPFHARAIENVKVYKGWYPAQYGDCLSGIIELTGNTVGEDQCNFGLGADLFQTSAFIQMPITNKLKFFSAVNLSFDKIKSGSIYRDIYSVGRLKYSSSLNEKNEALTGNYTFYRTINKLYYQPFSRDLFRFTFYTGKEKEFECKSDNQYKWYDTGLSSQWSHHWNSIVSSDLTISYAKNLHDHIFYIIVMQQDSGSDVFKESGKIECLRKDETRNTVFKLNNQIEMKMVELHFGGEILKQDFRFLDKVTFHPDPLLEKDPIDYSKTSIKRSIFIQSYWKLKKLLEYSMGVRTVNLKSSKKIYTMPRTSLCLFLSEQVSIKGAWGQYYQYFHPLYDEAENNFFSELFPGRSEQSILSLNYCKGKYHVNIDAYYKKYQDIAINSYNDLFVSPLLLYYEPIIYKNGNTSGLGLSIQKTSGIFSGWFCYDFSSSSYNVDNINSNNKFPESKQQIIYPIEHQQSHELKTALFLKLGKWKLSTSGIFAFVSQKIKYQLYSFPPPGYQLPGGDLTYSGNKGSFNYQRIDLSISRSFNNILYMNWELGISFINIFNHKNVFDRFYEEYTEGSELIYSEIVEKRMLPFMPLVYLNVTYR